MNSEELLKSISVMLLEHKDFLNSNPDIIDAIEDRLLKAIDDEDDEDGETFGEEQFSSMFDEAPQEEGLPEDVEFEDIDSDDEAAKWLATQEGKAAEAKPEKKVTSSGYREWQPKKEYKPQHQEAIDEFMKEGWSHREAERLVGAHDFHPDPKQSRIKPSEPSAKMFESVKGSAGDYLRNYERHISETADARKNPVKFANAQTRKAHEEVHGDYDKSYNEFISSDKIKDLRGRDRHGAIKDFKSKWHDDNPSHREKAINVAGSTSGAFEEAGEQRKEHLEEGERAIAEAGRAGTPVTTASEFSTAAAGGIESITGQGAAQMAGGTQEEGGFSVGTVKDPSLHIAEQYPEYADHLRRKIAGKLNPEQTQRLKGVQSIKKKGNK